MNAQELRTTRKRKTTCSVDLNAQSARAGPRSGLVPVPPIEIIDDADDDVIIASPRAFTQAKNISGRTRGGRRVIIDVESEEWRTKADFERHTKHRKLSTAHQTVINCEHYINLERENVQQAAPPPPPPPPPPPDPTFSCPVCIGPLVEEMTTKCGHIFCKNCIKTALTAQKKCPTCRRKTTMKDIIRIYLPSMN